MRIESVNPANGERLRVFESESASAVEAKVARAATAFKEWSRRPLGERAEIVARAGQILESERQAFGRLMTLEMGKLLGTAADEAAKCATACRYYAERGAEFMRPELVTASAEARDEIWFQPLGVVLAVMPWNFPFWQVIRFAAPALVAGNVGLLKHASNVPQCALALEDLFRRAGAPEGVFQALLIGSERGGGAHRRRSHRRGDGDRQRGGRARHRGRRGRAPEEDRPRAGRQRPVRGAAER